ncbi:MAG: helix-turn-helix domain-containing protein [Limnohabitans sp.]|jgi:IclR family pca regulon transcriptional regulator|nr:helix-turn-helix domain-containing protein [Limnohabitans sp.]
MVSPSASALVSTTHTKEFPIDPADLITGVGRALAVIEAFNDEYGRMTVTQVADRTGIPRTAARRYLLNLCHFGYADTDGKFFWLTPRILRLGQGYLDGARLPRLVQPFIQRLAMSSGETVNVSVLDGHELVYVARSNSPRVVSIGFYAGARVPAHVVGAGPAILSTLEDDALKTWIAEHEFSTFNSNAHLTPKKFEKIVLSARKNNYCISVGNLDQGLTGIAVPLRDRHGECKAALSMTIQTSIWDEATIVEKLLPLIVETAQVLRAVI